MDLMPTPEQDAIRDSVRTFLETELPMSRVRALMGAPAAAYSELWRGAAALGFFALGLPEALGGAGYALTEEMVLFEELGRTLAPGPWLGTVLAAHALARGGAEVRGPLAAVVAGKLRAAACIDPWGGPLAMRSHAVAADAEPSLDATNPVGTVAFRDAPCTVLARDAASAAALRRAATVLSCADAVGGTARTVEMSVAYAKVRHQFGKPIGSFQAVKHRCADMAVRAEVARASVTYAAVALAEGGDGVWRHAAMAKALAGDAAIVNATDNVQNHGGMGYTWESDAHLYLKRARLLEHCFGTRRTHLDALAAPWRVAR
jgi:alkylation response protein AidB-like acyl-CoA dehydrogenase